MPNFRVEVTFPKGGRVDRQFKDVKSLEQAKTFLRKWLHCQGLTPFLYSDDEMKAYLGIVWYKLAEVEPVPQNTVVVERVSPPRQLFFAGHLFSLHD